MMKDLIRDTAGIRRPGSAALDFAYVAAGRLDGFWELGLAPWDFAAGALLVKEAGGVVSDIAGGNRYIETGNIVTGGDQGASGHAPGHPAPPERATCAPDRSRD